MTYPYFPQRWLITTPDLSGDPDVFPLIPGQLFVSQKSPTFPKTIVKQSVSGREVRAGLSSAPLWQFKVGYEFIRDRGPGQNDLQKLYAFFCSRQGQLGTFHYYDPTDNLVPDCPTGTGDGETTTFQFQRQVAPGTPYAFTEPVYALNGAPTVRVNGVASTAFGVGAYGALVFDTAPPVGAQITWSGSFLFLCRFSQDQIDPAQMCQGLWSLDGLTFRSWKP